MVATVLYSMVKEWELEYEDFLWNRNSKGRGRISLGDYVMGMGCGRRMKMFFRPC